MHANSTSVRLLIWNNYDWRHLNDWVLIWTPKATSWPFWKTICVILEHMPNKIRLNDLCRLICPLLFQCAKRKSHFILATSQPFVAAALTLFWPQADSIAYALTYVLIFNWLMSLSGMDYNFLFKWLKGWSPGNWTVFHKVVSLHYSGLHSSKFMAYVHNIIYFPRATHLVIKC